MWTQWRLHPGKKGGWRKKIIHVRLLLLLSDTPKSLSKVIIESHSQAGYWLLGTEMSLCCSTWWLPIPCNCRSIDNWRCSSYIRRASLLNWYQVLLKSAILLLSGLIWFLMWSTTSLMSTDMLVTCIVYIYTIREQIHLLPRQCIFFLPLVEC